MPAMPAVKIPYGLREGKLLHISEIPESQRGLRCKCVCLGCGEQLQANLGRKNRHYFSHAVIGNCNGAAESGLHLKAKELIAESRQVVLPGLVVTAMGRLRPGVPLYRPGAIQKTVVKEGRLARFDRVLVEQARGSIRPDVTGLRGRAGLHIEVRVSHQVDEQKRAELRRQGVSAIEIDLSGLDRMASPAEIAKAVSDPSLSSWLFHRREDQARQEVRRQEKDAQAREAEAARQAEAQRQQARRDFRERLALLHQALSRRLLSGAPVMLPPIRPEPGSPELVLPDDYGVGLEVTMVEDWGVTVIRTKTDDEQEQFKVVWMYQAPNHSRPYGWNRLAGFQGPACAINVRSLLLGRRREGWTNMQLDAFLLGGRAKEDCWLQEPRSIAVLRARIQQVQREHWEAQQKAALEAERKEAEARLLRRQAALEREQVLAQRRTAQVQEEILYREAQLRTALENMRHLTQTGRDLLARIALRQSEIEAARQNLDIPLPGRWVSVKELSACHPPMRDGEVDKISGSWSAVAKAYPFEWVFSIHPDALKVALLSRLCTSRQPVNAEDLLQVTFACLSQTRQPGSKADGFGGLFFQTEKWSAEAVALVSRVLKLLAWELNGHPLPDSSQAHQAWEGVDAITQMMAQLSGKSDFGLASEDAEFSQWRQSRAVVVRAFCSALLQDVRLVLASQSE